MNVTANRLVADRAVVATSLWQRAAGLLPRTSLEAGEGMIFPHCRSIHTWGMRFAIDVLFTRRGLILRAVPSLGPWKLASAAGADTVIELPGGTIDACGLRDGVVLDWAA